MPTTRWTCWACASLGDPFVAPSHLRLQRPPVSKGPVQRQARVGRDLVGSGVFQNARQLLTQRLGPLREHQAEFSQQPANAVDAGVALLFVALAQPVHSQYSLLLAAFDRNKPHLRARGGFTDSCRIGRVVLAAFAFHPVRRDEMRGDQPWRQAHAKQLASPVMAAGASFHRHDAAGGQLSAPGGKLVSTHRARHNHPLATIDRMDLDLLLCQIDPDSCNLLHGLPLSKV
jgi:hypothetical protein